MGCCSSSPHARRRYPDPGDLDEMVVPIRHFGKFRNNSNVIPDDIDGLPSTHIADKLATHPDILLYEAELDQGRAFRALRPKWICCFCPGIWAYVTAQGVSRACKDCTCDEACCFLRKEYSTRSYLRIFSNRIESNNPHVRFPWGYCGCGSWNADLENSYMFDRGAFGFRRTPAAVSTHLCCCWPVYGGSVARQRCPCNGPLWSGGFWCDEWPCHMFCCSFHHYGLLDPDETAFAASIALQAYFEGRRISKRDMDRCVEYWKQNISEMGDPVGRKRAICCEPCRIPCCSCTCCYDCTHPIRYIPYSEEKQTPELKRIYQEYEAARRRQIAKYETFDGPVRYSTLCRMCGCRRVFGRRGLIFCTEGCCEPHQECLHCKKDDPAPTFLYRDFDDDNDASKVLMTVLGNPPGNVVYTRFEIDEEMGENVLVTYPKPAMKLADADIEFVETGYDEAEEDQEKHRKNGI